MTFLRSLDSGIRFLPATLAWERFVYLKTWKYLKDSITLPQRREQSSYWGRVPGVQDQPVRSNPSPTLEKQLSPPWGQQLVLWKVVSIKHVVKRMTLGNVWERPTSALKLPQSQLHSFRSSDVQILIQIFLGNHEPRCVHLVFLRFVQWNYLGQNQVGNLKTCLPCTLPRTYWIRASRDKKRGRVSVSLINVLGDSDILWILSPSWVGLGDGQQLVISTWGRVDVLGWQTRREWLPVDVWFPHGMKGLGRWADVSFSGKRGLDPHWISSLATWSTVRATRHGHHSGAY